MQERKLFPSKNLNIIHPPKVKNVEFANLKDSPETEEKDIELTELGIKPQPKEFELISPEYLFLLEEIEIELEKLISNRIEDLKYIIVSLKNYKSLKIDNFTNLNFLLVVYLDSKQLKDLAEKLASLSALKKIYASYTKSLQSLENIRNILIYLGSDKKFSFNFKEKILKSMNYDLSIFNGYSVKNKFVEPLMEANMEFFDQVLCFCKNSAFLKYYDYEESINNIIYTFYSYIEKKKLIECVGPEEFDEELLLNSRILDFCFKKKLKTMIKYITDRNERLLILPSVLVLSFQYSIYDYLKPHLNNKRLLKNLGEYNVMIEIFKLKNNPITLWDFFDFLYAMKDVEFKSFIQKYIYIEFKNFFQNKNDIQILIYHMNPLLIFVALSQLFYHLSKKSDNFHYVYRNLTKLVLKKCKDFIENYSDFDHLQSLISHKYAPFGKSVLDIIFEDTELFFPFFEEKRISTIVQHNLDSSIIFDFNLLKVSSIFKAFFEEVDLIYVAKEKTKKNPFDFFVVNESFTKNNLQKILTTIETEENLNVFKFIPTVAKKKKLVSQEENHFYQRKVFFSAISIRLLIEFIFFLGLLIYILFFTRNYTETNYFFYEINADYLAFNSLQNLTNTTLEAWREEGLNKNLSLLNLTTDQPFKDLLNSSDPSDATCLTEIYVNSYSLQLAVAFLNECKEFKTSINEFITINKELRILFIIIMVICGDLFLRKWYQINILKERFFTTMDIFQTLDIILCFLILMLYSTILVDYEIWHISSDFQQRISKFIDSLSTMSIFFALFIFLQWLKITQYIKTWNKFQFGFIIKTLEIMVRETAIFMFVYFINIAAFCSVLYIIFNFNEDFSTFQKGLRNLFGYSIGQFSFPDIHNDNFYEWLISIILIIFLVMSNIILLNLLIAILNNVFNKLSSRIDLENSHNNFMLKKEYTFHEIYGNMIFFPRTFNFLLLPLHIIALIVNNQKFTFFLIDIFFNIYFFIIFCFYLVANLFLLPLTWIKFQFLIMMDRYYDRSEHKLIPLSIRLIHYLFWFFGGLFYLIGVLIVIDIPIFVRSAYNEIEIPREPIIQFQQIMEKYIFQYLKKEQNENNSSEISLKKEEHKRTEKVKHKAFQDKIKIKLKNKIKGKMDLKQNNHMSKVFTLNSKLIENICGGIEYEEAVKIFNFSEEWNNEFN